MFCTWWEKGIYKYVQLQNFGLEQIKQSLEPIAFGKAERHKF